MTQVSLVADEHTDDVGVGVVSELLEPPLDVLERDAPRNVVDKERSYGSSIVRARDRSVP